MPSSAGGVESADQLAGYAGVRESPVMAAKKREKRARASPPLCARTGAEDPLHMIATALASHESSIGQLAEVVVNLHANIRALREVVSALADTTKDPQVTRAKLRLRRVKLDE
jgi:hypothetical protein